MTIRFYFRVITLAATTGFFCASSLFAEELTLEQAYALAQDNHPRTRAVPLQSDANQHALASVRGGLFPQIFLRGELSHQSDVPQISANIPGVGTPPETRYRTFLELNQILYDGGNNAAVRRLTRASGEVSLQQLAVESYARRQKIVETYYDLSSSQAQYDSLDALLNALTAHQRSLAAAVNAGVRTRADADTLAAEVLALEQQLDSAATRRGIAAAALSELLGRPVTANTNLAVQLISDFATDATATSRPELKLLEQRKLALKQQSRSNLALWLPRLNAYGQAGVGRPGLNFLSDELDTFYAAGVRLTWKLWDGGTTHHVRQRLDAERALIETERATFIKATQIEVVSVRKKIKQLNSALLKDKRLVQLRLRIAENAAHQLDEGVIRSTDYVDLVTDAQRAKLAQKLHGVQLAQAQATLKNLLGIDRSSP